MEHPVYQYFTIVSTPTTYLCPQNAFTYVAGSDENKLMYVSLEQQQDEEEEETFASNVLLDDIQPDVKPEVSDMEFVSVEDGQMYMTDTSSLDENFSTVDPELASCNSNESSLFTNENSAKTELSPSDNESDYRRIQLEDGKCAYIDKSLWHSLIENIEEDEEKETLPTKITKYKYACNYYGCKKMYSTAHHLRVHVRNHTGSRPYQCTIAGCEKAFATGYSLKAHLRTHTGETPYGCNVCPKQFKTSGDLQKHTRIHTGEKPFKCPITGCGRSFTTSNIRKVHVRSHTGERPYACTYADCGKAFASATNFKNHMRIHSGEKPYECTVEGCGKRFTEYSSLFKHNAVHKHIKYLRCEYCDHLCKHETSLQAHKQAKHEMIVTDDGTEIRLTKEY